MFSEALRIMDRNTTKYMFDDLHKQVDDLSKELADKDAALADKDAALADKDAALADKDRIIEMLEAEMKKMSGQ